MSKASLVATLTTLPSEDGLALKALPGAVEWLEVRADLVGDLDANWLRSHFTGRLLYALRSNSQGGGFIGSDRQRRTRLQQAAQHYDLVELEADRDLDSELLTLLPKEKRMISWYGHTGDRSVLQTKFAQLSRAEASVYKLVVAAASVGEALSPLALLQILGRCDVIAFAEGTVGTWTRLVAPRLGAAMVFGRIEAPPADAGEPTVASLMNDYGLPSLPSLQQLFGIVGGRVGHSPSPRLHNAAYRALGMPALYVPFSVPSFSEFWEQLARSDPLGNQGIRLKGFSLAAPHKEAAFAAADTGSAIARRAGAANVLSRSGASWHADTADADGVLLPLKARQIDVQGKSAAVIGCGGAGRAAAVALDEAGARVTVINRTEEHGPAAAQRLGLPFVPLSRMRAEDYKIVVNATPVGRAGEELPVAIERLDREGVVIDFVFGPQPTPLVREIRKRGGTAIEGREVLYYQARRQFHLMTGAEMPPELVRELLCRN
jgi:3-dehydroquinate dehydratase/shikimate dehydrogenase